MVSSSWLKGIAALLAGVLALYWQPGLEAAQNSIIAAGGISGQVVVFIWLFLAFSWAFIGALIGYVAFSVVLYYANKNALPKKDPSEGGSW